MKVRFRSWLLNSGEEFSWSEFVGVKKSILNYAAERYPMLPKMVDRLFRLLGTFVLV